MSRDRLQPGRDYQFQVAAINGNTHGPPSDMTPPVFVKPSEVASDAPPKVTGVRAYYMHGQPALRWNKIVATPTQGVVHYAVKYQLSDTSVWRWMPQAEKLDVTAIKLSGEELKTDKYCRFAVVANNNAGSGSTSEPSQDFLFGISPPLAPPTMTVQPRNDGAVAVAWSAAKGSKHPTHSYKVTINQYGDLQQHEGHDVGPKLETVVEDLKPNTMYMVSISAKNDAGWGEQGKSVTFTTKSVHHSDLFLIMWVSIEVLLVIFVAVVIYVIWKQKKSQMSSEYHELDHMRYDDEVDSFDSGHQGVQTVGWHPREAQGSDIESARSCDLVTALGDPEELKVIRELASGHGLVHYLQLQEVMENLKQQSEAGELSMQVLCNPCADCRARGCCV